jgi:hypothetical protein
MSHDYIAFFVIFKKTMNEEQMQRVKERFESMRLIEKVEAFTLDEFKKAIDS